MKKIIIMLTALRVMGLNLSLDKEYASRMIELTAK